jgi:general stress protein 26
VAVEEAVRGLCQPTAVAWVARGDEHRTRYGFTDKDQRVTLELKNGDKAPVEFSALASPNSPYAAVTMDGQLWIFQFPTWLYDYVQRYLSVPLNP